MSKDNSNPAFPAPEASIARFGEGNADAFMGISIRDYFAAKAITMFQGVEITCETDIRRRFDFSDAASLAYQYADAMLAERAK